MSWLASTRTRLRLLFARRAAESRMDEEFRFHLDMETERLVREHGLEPAEARRQALVAFGGVERHKEELRDGRGLAWLGGLALDLKLGFRMLAKYPGLTLVCVVSMAVAVAICAAAFGVLANLVDSELPLPEGERIVAIQNVDTRASSEASGTYLHDMATWRESLKAIEELGAYRTIERNLLTPKGPPEAVHIAEMTASGFRLTRVPPIVGRYFNDADERKGAAPVVVIGYDVWQNRFSGRQDVVGQMLQLGATRYAIIGVMPQGYAFPINHHFWTPLRLDPSEYALSNAPALEVFGRLVAGATLRDAQTQLTAIGARLTTAYPASHQHVRPRVLPYTLSINDSPEVVWTAHIAQLLVALLLVVIGTNVAILVYARTATRVGEIAVRSALGASRSRIVGQLFAEALVLSGIAAAVGILGAWAVLQQLHAFLLRRGGEGMPFWWHFGISPTLAMYVAGLAVTAALIVGVVPALKATGPRVQVRLQQLSSRGSQMQLGRAWTALIVAQVAVAVAVLPFAVSFAAEWVAKGMQEPGYPAEKFLRASLSMGRAESAPGAGVTAYQRALEDRFRNRVAEVLRRLEAEPAVAGVTFAASGGAYGRIEVEDAGTPMPATTQPAEARLDAAAAVRTNRVDTDFFDIYDVPVLAGRRFVEADAREGSTAVIVNRLFAEQILGSGNALGRRIRYVRGASEQDSADVESNPWLEIVGVVPEFQIPFDGPRPELYRPVTLTQSATALNLIIRVRASPASKLAGRFREVVASVDPTLQLHGLQSAADHLRQYQRNLLYMALGVVVVTLSVLLLSAAGIYSMMSFTVTKRQREIGIRSALGAEPSRILRSVFARASAQLAAGVLVGLLGAVAVDRAMGGKSMDGRDVVLLPLVAVLMMATGLLAALGPARRGLAVQPTEALREE